MKKNMLVRYVSRDNTGAKLAILVPCYNEILQSMWLV
jgi:hypothetical protein